MTATKASAVAVDVRLPLLTDPQMAIVHIDDSRERCVDVEGSPRSAKSWGVAFWLWKLVLKYPGIQIFYARYKDEGLAQLRRDVWAPVSAYFPEYLQPTWSAADQAWAWPNESRLYLSSIKAADTDSLHSKYKGKTLAVIVIEEAQELPQANYIGLKERLSQSRHPVTGVPTAYPLHIVLVHNCTDEDHWIAREFPLAGLMCTADGHRYINADLYSNAGNLGPDVIAGYERDYPPGHPQRRTVIEGRRGVTLTGTPVYRGAFDRTRHVSQHAVYHPYYPILEGWDFGQEKPAVVWAQYHAHVGALRVIGYVKGRELFLETFAPHVLAIRQRLFPGVADVWAWADPSGQVGNMGTQHTAVRVLQDMGIHARTDPAANQAATRYQAIMTLAGFMQRVARDGSPAFLMCPTGIELVADGAQLIERDSDLLEAGFVAGYVWDEHAPPDANPNVRKPRKGTRYDDLQNALEYILIGQRLSVPSGNAMWQADRQMADAARAVTQATIAAGLAAKVTGPTGETLAQVERRLVQELKRGRQTDGARRPSFRPTQTGGRGGW